ncbi:MAG: hypothetical protein ACU836_07325 [Gammaproteobacteria bacterium]
MNRRDCLKSLAALIATLGCEKESFSKEKKSSTSPDTSNQLFGDTSPFNTTVSIDIASPGRNANAALCGSNVQWVDGGDGLLPVTTGIEIIQDILQKAMQLAPTVIRYPGGSQASVYHWQAGIGAESERGTCEHFHRKDSQIVRFGTGEFLALCDATGAVPLITVNVATGTPEEAAAWVKATNIDGMTSSMTGLRRLPKVIYWEIGNEPYLKEDVRPETWMTPDDYASRANAFIKAMRAVDPTIKVGIPLRSDTFNGIPVTPYPGYNETVLSLLSESFDFACLHNAYMPFLYADVPTDNEIYAGLMAASETVRLDIEATRAQENRILGKTLPLAITEYNGLVTLGKSQDYFIASPAGALYVADVLRMLASQPDILTADHWSLIGNWYFGAMTSTGIPRPEYEVLRLYKDTLRGQMLSSVYTTKTFSAPQMGIMQAASNLPVVNGTATLEAGKLRLLVINKDPQATSNTTIKLTSGNWGSTVTTNTLAAANPFATPETANAFVRSNAAFNGGQAQVSVPLPPCSLTLIETQLA